MEFENSKSIFLQIADTVSDRILRGVYPPGGKVPSVRELAGELGVNPNTIVRTYSELQTAGIIENRRGIGFFVQGDAVDIITARKRADFYSKILPDFLRQAAMLGITSTELCEQLEKLNIQIHEKK